MIVFKTFLKVLKSCIIPITMYTAFLIIFAGFNMQTSDNSMSFTEEKPDIAIVNNDKEKGITKALIEYITQNSNIIQIKHDGEEIDDALFYRDVNYVIYIPNNFRDDFLQHKNPKIEIKSTGDYQASLAEMILERYLKVAEIYNNSFEEEAVIIQKTNETLENKAKTEITSKLDTNNLSRATFYYNFLSYSVLAGCVYVICLILSSFKSKNISKRTIVSSMNYKKYNRSLLVSNGLFAVVLWMFYVILSFILLGDIMFTMNGFIYIINSLIFTLCALSIAFLIGNLVNNKEAINGIVNVVALGSSFLCGAFVPVEMLPDTVLKVAHVLPTYWYINTNELLKTTESFDFETMKPIFINFGVIIAFMIGFIVITNIVSSRKRKMD